LTKKKTQKLVIVTGLSGSGKSTAIRVLEDLGYYCVDNLPSVLIPKFLELCANSTEEFSLIGLGIDVREGDFLKMVPVELKKLKNIGIDITVIFLDAADESLIRRYSETRRKHPLDFTGSVRKGIAMERKLLSPVRAIADIIVDSTMLNVNQLRAELFKYLSKPRDKDTLTINLISFGYRFGIPSESDTVMDVRFLPNPYFHKNLKNFSGLDKKVQKFILSSKDTSNFLKRWFSFLEYILPQYRNEGKKYFTISVGCTGGKHRSVAIVEKLKEHLKKQGFHLTIKHRDVNKI